MRSHLRHSRLLIVLCGLFGRYAYLFNQGAFSFFVHPRLHVFTYLMMGGIVCLLIYMAVTVDTHKVTRYSLSGTGSLILLMLALLPALGAQLDPDILPVADMTTQALSTKNTADNTLTFDQEGSIVMTSDNYYATIVELYTDPQAYRGMSLRAQGVVYSVKGDAPNEFGAGLYYMTCCAADAQLVGLKYQVDGTAPEIGQWVELSGILELDSDGSPLVRVEQLQTIPPLDDPYMYY